jgi:hypothetical protein
MGRAIRSYDEWLVYVFDHPVDHLKPAWYFDLDVPVWAEEPVAVSYLTRLFDDPVPAVAPYSDAQINQGFWFLLSNACSDHMRMLLEPRVPWPELQRCVEAMVNVFATLFAPRCAPKLSHLDEPGTTPLNSVCYMWFDLLPIYGGIKDDPVAENRQLGPVLLDVMRRILDLESVACRESALHGLGHWQPYYPKQVVAIIDAFLKKNPGLLRDTLRDYALAARQGCVL